MSDIHERKRNHLDLCLHEDVAFRKSTLLEEVILPPDGLPELSFDEIDATTHWLGRTMRAPLLIAGMSGGIDRAAAMNRDLALAAQQLGIALGVGSQRVMLRHKEQAASFAVRKYAPDIPLLANIGVVQAAAMGTQELADLTGAIDADALCIHLNPAMEMVQPEGDRDFRGGLDAIARIAAGLGRPVIVKQTGEGMSRTTLHKLKGAGVRTVDVGGAGGTSWTAVETLRAQGQQRKLGETFWDWGVPLAPSVRYAAEAGFEVIATGGLRNGLDAARALALGASVAGYAVTALRAWSEGGVDGLVSTFGRFIDELRTAALLTGTRRVAGLRDLPLHLGPNLRRWIDG